MQHDSQPGPLASPPAWNAVAGGYAAELLPIFSLYSRDALDLAELPPRAQVLDVAAGPGTLSLLAAEQAEQVVAVDFAASMLEVLNQRLLEAELVNVATHCADGQALPFGDNSFDCAFSMFGLMFFPDRAAGFAELYRVLVPGGRALVSSWTPIAKAPLLAAMFDIIASLLPDLAFGNAPPPLAHPDECRQEMARAGFCNISMHTLEHPVEVASIREFWASQEQASAPIRMLRAGCTEQQWRQLSSQLIDELEEQFGSGPHRFTWPANLAVGEKPLPAEDTSLTIGRKL